MEHEVRHLRLLYSSANTSLNDKAASQIVKQISVSNNPILIKVDYKAFRDSDAGRSIMEI